MRRYSAGLLLLFLISLFLFFLTSPSRAAQDCTKFGDPELNKLCHEINQLERDLELSQQATQPLEVELDRLEGEIDRIQARIDQIGAQTDALEASIFEREVNLAYQQELLAVRVRSFYIRSQLYSPLLLLLSSSSAAELTRELSYRTSAANEDRRIIRAISEEIIQLEADKERLASERTGLSSLQANLDSQAQFLSGEIQSAKAYQAQISSKIAELSARQQAILAEKSGTFQTTVGEVPPADDPASRPDYNPGFSPAFAAFSFGAPHFKGMSQYGAYGRAKSGQNEEEILRAYYGDVRLETVDTGGDINTSAGSMSFEDRYLPGIAEMPSSWTDNNSAALKAQVIAARSYALAYVGWRMGNRVMPGSICISENCQVWSSSKADNPPAAWKQAVSDTRGKIIVGNGSGEVVNAWYASTSGGYMESYSSLGHTTSAFWDTPSGRSGWTSQAYEKVAGSPWFYKGWYKNRAGDACGRSHPWLTAEELADVLNAWVVLIKHGQADDRVTPQGPCWGGNPYSISELRSRAAGLSDGYSSVSSVSVTYSDSGFTANVTFATDKGGQTLNGADFKKAFNLRAPGRIALKSGLFNLEQK